MASDGPETTPNNMLTAVPTKNLNVFVINKPRDVVHGIGGGTEAYF
jgi:hypothetical protein